MYCFLDFLIRQLVVRCDSDTLLFSGAQILRRHIYNSIRIDVKRHLNLRHTGHRTLDAAQTEVSKQRIVPRKLALALQYLDINRCLEIRRRRKYLAVSGRDRRITLDDPRRHAANCLNGKRQRCHIHQNQIGRRPGRCQSAKLCSLHRCTERHAFIRIQIV